MTPPTTTSMTSPTTTDPSAPQAMPVVVLAKEITVRKFFGTEGESYQADEFEEEIRRAWNAQPGLSQERRLDLLKGNIGPVVRDELRCQDVAVQEDPDQALSTIVQIFGERRSPSTLLQAIFSTQQYHGETIRAYSHRLRSLYDKLTKRQIVLGETKSEEKVLRDHFINSLSDLTLIRYLREQVYQRDPCFKELRATAIRWADDEGATAASAAAVVAARPTPAAQPTSSDTRLDRLEEMMEKVLKCLEHQPAMPRYQKGPPRKGRGFNEKGQIICYECNQPNHLARDCPVRLNRLSGNGNPLL